MQFDGILKEEEVKAAFGISVRSRMMKESGLIALIKQNNNRIWENCLQKGLAALKGCRVNETFRHLFNVQAPM